MIVNPEITGGLKAATATATMRPRAAAAVVINRAAAIKADKVITKAGNVIAATVGVRAKVTT
jgi:hypothetical protein